MATLLDKRWISLTREYQIDDRDYAKTLHLYSKMDEADYDKRLFTLSEAASIARRLEGELVKLFDALDPTATDMTRMMPADVVNDLMFMLQASTTAVLKLQKQVRRDQDNAHEAETEFGLSKKTVIIRVNDWQGKKMQGYQIEAEFTGGPTTVKRKAALSNGKVQFTDVMLESGGSIDITAVPSGKRRLKPYGNCKFDFKPEDKTLSFHVKQESEKFSVKASNQKEFAQKVGAEIGAEAEVGFWGLAKGKTSAKVSGELNWKQANGQEMSIEGVRGSNRFVVSLG